MIKRCQELRTLTGLRPSQKNPQGYGNLEGSYRNNHSTAYWVIVKTAFDETIIVPILFAVVTLVLVRL